MQIYLNLWQMKIFFFYTEAVSDKIISPYNDKHFTISNFSKLLVLADTNRVLYWVSVSGTFWRYSLSAIFGLLTGHYYWRLIILSPVNFESNLHQNIKFMKCIKCQWHFSWVENTLLHFLLLLIYFYTILNPPPYLLLNQQDVHDQLTFSLNNQKRQTLPHLEHI